MSRFGADDWFCIACEHSWSVRAERAGGRALTVNPRHEPQV